jgi:hypothetical protein
MTQIERNPVHCVVDYQDDNWSDVVKEELYRRMLDSCEENRPEKESNDDFEG